MWPLPDAPYVQKSSWLLCCLGLVQVGTVLLTLPPGPCMLRHSHGNCWLGLVYAGTVAAARGPSMLTQCCLQCGLSCLGGGAHWHTMLSRVRPAPEVSPGSVVDAHTWHLGTPLHGLRRVSALKRSQAGTLLLMRTTSQLHITEGKGKL